MKKLLVLTCLLALTACGDNATTDEAQTVEDGAFDTLMLAYINLDKGSVQCEKKQINKWSFAACRFTSLNGKSSPQIWHYDNQKDPIKRYYAFTGKARSTYEANMRGNPILGDYPETFGLPIPAEMDMGEIVKAFNE